MTQTPENILIIKPSALGDIVLALPALNALRTFFPQARIGWLIQPEFASLLEGHPQLDDLIPFDRRGFAHCWRSLPRLRALLNLRRDLRTRRFDCVLDFQGLLRSALLARASDSPLRVGMATAREGAGLFYTRRIPQDGKNLHLVDYYQKMVQSLSDRPLPEARFLFPPAPDAEAWTRDLLRAGMADPGRYVVFVAGSAQSDKCWPADRFARLAERIHQRYGLPILAVGGAGERETIEAIDRLSPCPIENLAGKTTLPRLVALLRSARLVVANDTGPGHVAAGLGVALVMLFSWSNPARIFPYRRPECMVAIDPFGRGHEIKSRDPRHNVRHITVGEVFAKVCEQLNGPPERATPL